MANLVAMIRLLFPILLLVFPLSAAEWQWSVPEGNGRAFLWIPPDCERVRAVVVAQHNMLEESVLEHPEFRRELAKLGIAEMWIAPKVAKGPDIEDGAGERYLELLGEFVGESGYTELDKVPLIPMGHSACATIPWNFAAKYPERTLAILSVKGDAPQTTLTGNGRARMDWDGRRIDGIPGLIVMGEYEWTDERLQPGLEFRIQFPKSCIALLAEAGEGHFDASDDLVRFLAMFIRKSAGARLGDGHSLKAVDPDQGWLVQRWRLRQARDVPPAPAASYSGSREEAFWAFDEEMARMIAGYHAEEIDKKPQLLGFAQQGKTVPQVDRHEQVNLRFLPDADGVSFKLEPVFLSKVESGSANLARWTGLPIGSPLGHSTSETKIVRITGPFAEVGENRFELCLNRSWIPSDRRHRQLWFAARNPGDGDYGPAVQQAMMTLSDNAAGKPQIIRFPFPGNAKASAEGIHLAAESDAPLKVRYYVREGPAEVLDRWLMPTRIPPRAKYPVKVTVVAWQLGNAGFRPAVPVEHTILLTR
jgi:hypothetical protein